MSSSVKVSSSWKRITGLSAKVGGNWKTATAAYVKVAGTWKQWYAAVIYDTFTRSTSGTLGTSTSGASWSNVRGTWAANGSSAQSGDAASSYPLATVGFGSPSLLISADVTSGTGVSFWVQDSNNWWAAYVYANSYSYNYSCSVYQCYGCQTSSTGCTGLCGNSQPAVPDSQNCACNNGYTDNCAYQTQVFGCNAGNYTYNYCMYNIVSCGGTPTTYKCMQCQSVTYPDTMNCYCYNSQPAVPDSNNCGPCYGTCCGYFSSTCSATAYEYFVKLIRSSAGTVTEIATTVNLGSQPAALQVEASNSLITVKAFSDTALTSQLGSSLTHTPVSPTIGLSAGIIKAPSNYNAGSTVDNIYISL